jgi:hypothetical protein
MKNTLKKVKKGKRERYKENYKNCDRMKNE